MLELTRKVLQVKEARDLAMNTRLAEAVSPNEILALSRGKMGSRDRSRWNHPTLMPQPAGVA